MLLKMRCLDHCLLLFINDVTPTCDLSPLDPLIIEILVWFVTSSFDATTSLVQSKKQ